ncbi:MAG: hypothetical protein IJ301_05750 [Clostridia bacterium]|nr:hypothetical protein [Clostridia bacterium]
MKIWTKIIQGEKILKDSVWAPDGAFDYSCLGNYIEEICNKLDEPTPIILRKHLNHLNEFGNTHFKQEDFVESVFFDRMAIEIFDENSQKKTK